MRIEARLAELALVLPEPVRPPLVCLAMLGSLKRALGDLDRVTAWLRVFGMVNSAPDFAALTFNIPVEIEAEVEFS